MEGARGVGWGGRADACGGREGDVGGGHEQQQPQHVQHRPPRPEPTPCAHFGLCADLRREQTAGISIASRVPYLQHASDFGPCTDLSRG